MEQIMVFITAADKKEGEKIADILIDRRIAACANIIEGVVSCFRWEGKKEKSKECLLITKTVKSNLRKLIKTVLANHSYMVPEIIAVPIIAGYKPYLNWIKEETK